MKKRAKLQHFSDICKFFSLFSQKKCNLRIGFVSLASLVERYGYSAFVMERGIVVDLGIHYVEAVLHADAKRDEAALMLGAEQIPEMIDGRRVVPCSGIGPDAQVDGRQLNKRMGNDEELQSVLVFCISGAKVRNKSHIHKF
jgi:hypothetical protein